MAAQLDLHEGETVLKEVSGDYWKKSFLFMYNQKTGRYWFTSERIIFRSGLLHFRACLKIAFRQLRVPLRGSFDPNEGRMAGYVTGIWTKWGAKMTGLNVQIRSGTSD